jgi:hypothetical protein
MRRADGRGPGRRLVDPHRFAEIRGFSAGRELAIAADDVRGVQASLVSYKPGEPPENSRGRLKFARAM